jgi:hypothetical protein
LAELESGAASLEEEGAAGAAAGQAAARAEAREPRAEAWENPGLEGRRMRGRAFAFRPNREHGLHPPYSCFSQNTGLSPILARRARESALFLFQRLTLAPMAAPSAGLSRPTSGGILHR